MELSISKRHPARKVGTRSGQCRPQRLAAGLPFPVPKILELVAFRDSGKVFSSNFPRTFPEFSPGTPEQTPKTATALCEFSEQRGPSKFAAMEICRENANGCHILTGNLRHYSEGQKHVIQLKYSQESISPNTSSQLQLGNSPDLISLISTGRCQLDDFHGSPPGFCCGCPSISGVEISTKKILRITRMKYVISHST